jgi:hypothetical protein
VFVKNDLSKDPVDQVEQAVQFVKDNLPSIPTIVRSKSPDNHLLVIDPADLHIGKLCTNAVSGDTYNIEIAKDRAIKGVVGLLEKSYAFNLDKIMLIMGNDILHIDNAKRTTTGGTPQDTD